MFTMALCTNWLPDFLDFRVVSPVFTRQLTVITISDHHTRVSTGGGAQEAGGRVIGLLFGSQNGLDVSIYDAMEVACTAVGPDSLELNEASVEKQKDLCKSDASLWTCDAVTDVRCYMLSSSLIHPDVFAVACILWNSGLGERDDGRC